MRNIWRSTALRGGGLIALGLVGAVCSDLTAPEGLKPNVTIAYEGPPVASAGVIQVIVGQRLAPAFRVDLGGQRQTRARYFYSLPTAADSTVLRVYGNGDSVEVLGRGNATLSATLVGATIGTAQNVSSNISVVATPASNRVDSTSLTFRALGSVKQMVGTSRRQDGSSIPLQSTSLSWASNDPNVVTVNKLNDSTVAVTAVANGATTITATFDGIDVVTVPVTVSQVFTRYHLTTVAFGAGEITMIALGDTITVRATAQDSLGRDLQPGSQTPPTPTFFSSQSGRASIGGVTGIVTAVDNTDPTLPARIYVTTGTGPRSDTLPVTVRQVATSIVIGGPRSDTIKSVGATKTFTAVARDRNNRDLPPSFITWSTIDQNIAQVNAGPPVTATGIAVGTTRLAAARPIDNRGDTITLVVSNSPATIDLQPASLAILSLDDTVRFASVTVRNSKGDILTGETIVWTSQNPTIVEALPDGRMVSKALGQTQVIAQTTNGIADTSDVVVTNSPETLDIIPTSVTMASTGDTVAVAVDFRNSRGVSLPSSAATWSSADASIARVAADGSGRIIATGSGDTYVLAVSPTNSAKRDSVLVTVTNAPAAIATSPSTPQTLTSFGQTLQFTATVFNARGNPIPNAQVRWSVPTGGAALTIDSISGLATSVANGAATVRASSGSVTSDLGVTVAQQFSPSTSTILPRRGSINADGVDTTTVTIQLRDANNNNYQGGGVTVIPTTSRGTLSNFTDQGGGTYTVLLTAGTQSGLATIAATVNSIAIQNNGLVTFNPGPATQYVVVILPNASPLAGDNVTVVAQLADQYGNQVTNQVKSVTWSSTNGGTFTPSTPQTTSNGRVIVTFTTSTAPGTVHTLTATDNTTPTALTGSAALITRSGGPTKYLVSVSASSPAAGDSVTITARLADANNNFERIPGRTVNWSSTGGGGFATASSTTDGDGIATVRFRTNTTASTTHTVRATDAATPALQGNSPSFTTVPGPADMLTIEAQPSASAQAGIAFGQQPVIYVRDAYGNHRTSDNTTVVTAARSAGSSSLLGTVSRSASGGIVTFTDLRYNVVETITIAFTSAMGLATSNNVVVAPGPVSGATTLITAAPTAIVADGASTSTITVQAKDGQGNNLVASGGVVTLSSTLGSVGPVTDNNNGTYTATLTAGIVSGTATITGTIAGSPISDDELVAFNPSSPTKYIVTGPATATAGSSTLITAQLADANNNPVRIEGRTVVWSKTGPGGTFATPSSITDVNGVATIAFTGTLVGAHTITGTDNTGLTGTSGTVSVVHGPLASFVVEQTAPGGNIPAQTAGNAFNVRLTAIDAYGNRVNSFTGTVQLTGGAGTTVQGQPVTSAAFATGRVNSQSITVTSAGSAKSIVATNSAGTESGTSNTFDVSPAALNNFLVEGAGGGAIGTQTAGTAFNIRVTARDVFNNTVTGFGGTVNISGGAGTTVQGQPVASAAFSGGVLASQAVTVTTAGGGKSITVVNTAGAQTGTSATFDVNPGALNNFLVEAAGGGAIGTQNADNAFNIRITARDAFNNTVTGFTGTVSLTGGAATTLLGQPVTSANFAAGVLASQSVQVTTAGANKSIVATNSAGPESGTSGVFTVDPGFATTAQSQVTASPTNIAAIVGTSTIEIQLKDQFGNNTGAVVGAVTLTTTDGTLTGSLVNNGNGRYTQTLQANAALGTTATLTGFINGVAITDTATVNW